MQTLVENSVKHAVSRQSLGRRDSASADRARTVRCASRSLDEGPGFALESAPAGHGLDNLKGRLAALFGAAGRAGAGALGEPQSASRSRSLRAPMHMRAFLVDDEALALKRLSRMLAATGRVEIVGQSMRSGGGCRWPSRAPSRTCLFLDIEMPGMTGFEMLAQMDPQPLIVFTTAYDRYALRGVRRQFDRLPVEAHRSSAARSRRWTRSSACAAAPSRGLRSRAAGARGGSGRSRQASANIPIRIASRIGERVEFVELSRVTHFFASDKLTYAATAAKNYVVDHTIQELEQKLDPRKFIRIHRATLLNLDYIHELHAWFAGRMMVRLKDEKKTELTVSRDRVRTLKERLGI